MKKSVVRSCVWKRGSRVQSFKKIGRKIVQLFYSSLLEQGCGNKPVYKIAILTYFNLFSIKTRSNFLDINKSKSKIERKKSIVLLPKI